MHYTDIPLYPYHIDPLRILVPRNSRPADAPASSSGPPASAASTDRPPGAEANPAGSASEPGKILPVPAKAGIDSGRGTALGRDPGTVEGDGAQSAAPDAAQGAAAPSIPMPAAGPYLSDAAGDVERRPSSGSELGEDRNGDGGADESEVDDSAPEQDDPKSERDRLMSAWLEEHFDTIEAMARAGEVPVRPAPAHPEPGRGAHPNPAPAKRPPPSLPPIHVARGDRWNKPKMAQFLRQLAATHSVTAAARSVGMSRRSAYKLRTRLKGQPFDIAWEAAFRHGYDNLPHAALELALEGEEVPHYYQGELVGTHRKRHPQLMIGLLKMRNRAGAPMLGRYGAAAEFWSEQWERMVHRVETGSVTWDDERDALGPDELERLGLPDADQELKLIELRNMPDEPPKDR